MLCTSERPSFAGLSANIRICLQRHCGGIRFICSSATSVSDYSSAVSRHNSMDVVWCNAYVCRTKQGLSQSMPIHKQMGSICAMYRRHIHISSTATQHQPHKLTNDKLHTSTKSCFTQVFLETIPHEHPSSCLGNLRRSAPNPPQLGAAKFCKALRPFQKVWALCLMLWVWDGGELSQPSVPHLCTDTIFITFWALAATVRITDT